MQRNIALDLLKIILAFFVVALHVNLFFDINYDLSFLLKNGLFRIAVPIFLIVTGYYFVNIDDVDKLKKWILRIFLLYLTWMVFYSYFWVDYSLSVFSIIRNIIIFLLGYNHLWYLSGALVGGGFLFIIRNLDLEKQIAFAIGFFFIGTTLQYLGNTHMMDGAIDKLLNDHYVSRNAITVCFPFMFIGYLINKYKIIQKCNISLLLLLLLFSLIMLELESYINLKYISNTEPLDLLFSLLFVCPIVFVLVMKFKIKSGSKNIGLLSSGIYLIHPLFIYFISGFNFNSIVNYTMILLVSILSSIFLVVLNKKFKFIL